jgi:hypothetical protein
MHKGPGYTKDQGARTSEILKDGQDVGPHLDVGSGAVHIGAAGRKQGGVEHRHQPRHSARGGRSGQIPLQQ